MAYHYYISEHILYILWYYIFSISSNTLFVPVINWERNFTGFLLLCQYDLYHHASLFSKTWKALHGLLFICWSKLLSELFFFLALCLLQVAFALIPICIAFKLLQGPLAWALIIWRCSLVFSSADKIVSVLIHLLPGKLANLLTI